MWWFTGLSECENRSHMNLGDFSLGGHWALAAIMVVIASWILYKSLAPKGLKEWRSAGLVQAFIIALYAEMYGFPLTIYLLTSFLGLDIPWLHMKGHLWSTLLGLGDAGAVVRPFVGDIEETRKHVLDKPWQEREIEEMRKTPSLLMIGEDFDVFDPRRHSWIHLNFGERVDRGVPGVSEFRHTLEQLADAVQNPTEDVFAAAHRLIHRVRLSDAAEVFEAKPGTFGFSIDLIRGAKLVSSCISPRTSS